MRPDTRVTIFAVAHNLAALLCLVLMYVAYRLITNEHLFAAALAILGVGVGFFLTKGSAVRADAQLGRILSTALVKEKELETHTLEELKGVYQKELQNLKSVIEKEANHLLLTRLRELYLQDVRGKLREIESIDNELKLIQAEPTTAEVKEIRVRLGSVLASVLGICCIYPIPFGGNLIRRLRIDCIAESRRL
jgi:hypothetical protein